MEPQEFGQNIKRLVLLQQQLKVIADEAKQKRTPLKTELTDLEVNIKDYMKSSEVQVANYQDFKIEVQTVERYGSLTQKTLKAALVAYFQNEPVAEECFQFIRDKLGKKEVDILRKTKRKKETKKRKAVKKEEKQTEEPVIESDSEPEDDGDDVEIDDDDEDFKI